MSIDVRLVQTSELLDQSQFLSKMYGSIDEVEFGIKDLQWAIDQPPHGKGVIAGAFSGPQLAGFLSFVPRRFMLDGEPVQGAELSGAFVDSDFRGKGIFKLVLNKLLEEAPNLGIRFIFGTPNANAHPIYVKTGWESLQPYYRYIRPVLWAPALRKLGPLAKPVGGVLRVGHDALFSSKRPDNVKVEVTPEMPDLDDQGLLADAKRRATTVARNRAYIAWRCDRPGFAYEHMTLNKGDEILGWAMFRAEHEGKANSRLWFGDYWTKDGDQTLVKVLLTELGAVARERNITALYHVGRPYGASPDLTKLGFFKRDVAGMPIVAISPDRSVDVNLLRHWDYRAIESDMF